MLHDVLQALLRDAVQRQLDVVGQAHVGQLHIDVELADGACEAGQPADTTHRTAGHGAGCASVQGLLVVQVVGQALEHGGVGEDREAAPRGLTNPPLLVGRPPHRPLS